jgi:hypothetical protein
MRAARKFSSSRAAINIGGTKQRELHQLYGGRKPADYLPAHNHVLHTPEFTHGVNGFRRFWIPPQWAKGREWSRCSCGWRGHDPKWQVHYAHSDHAKWWKNETAKRGSLEAVYRFIRRELRKHGQVWMQDP